MKKCPYIILFKTFNNFYFYDINTKEMIKTDYATYKFLEEIVNHNDCIDKYKNVPYEVQMLHKKGFLLENKIKKVINPRSKYIETILDRRVQKITLQLTQDCNFRCKYCHYTSNSGGQRTHSDRNMTLNIAKKSIDFLKEHSIDSPEVYVGFYGGEPLLEFEMIKQVVEYTENIFKGKKVNYTISTNATLITDEIMTFFVNYDFDILISLDGPQDIHNKNRIFTSGKGSFESVINHISVFYKKYKEFYDKKIMINTVVDPSFSFKKYSELFNLYPFISNTNFSYSILDDYGAEIKNEYSEEFKIESAYNDFLANLVLLNKLEDEDVSLFVRKLVSSTRKDLESIKIKRKKIPEEWAPGGPCMPGEMRLMVTVDGNFVTCERVNEISECMIIGNIFTGFNFSKVRSLLNIAQITEKECMECIAFEGCQSCCKYADDKGILSAEIRKSYCQENIDNYIYLLKRMLLLMESFELYDERPSV